MSFTPLNKALLAINPLLVVTSFIFPSGFRLSSLYRNVNHFVHRFYVLCFHLLFKKPSLCKVKKKTFKSTWNIFLVLVFPCRPLAWRLSQRAGSGIGTSAAAVLRLDDVLLSGKLYPLPSCSDSTSLSQLARFGEVLFGLWGCPGVSKCLCLGRS